MDIQTLFQKSKELYGQNIKNFYISSKDYKGIHPAVLPQRENYKFSEYIFGNPQDMLKLSNEALNKGIFKSFYCSLCTLEEPDNLSIRSPSPCGDLKLVENVANKVKIVKNIDGIDFLITATVPQYFYNHLLISTRNHFNNYIIFQDHHLFKSFFALLTTFPDNSNVVFNGNFGSDRWHFHTHLTNQKISYIENAIGTLGDAKGKDIDKTGIHGIIKYRLVASRNLKDLQKQLQLYTRVYYTDIYQSGKKYLSAAFKTIKHNGEPYYMVFLLTGIRQGSQNVKDNTYFCLLPSGILSIGGKGIPKQKDVESFVNIISESGAYDYIKPYTENIGMQPFAELFEKDYAKQCVKLIQSKILKSKVVANIMNNINQCIKGPQRCAGSNMITFAAYKYIMSMLFICTSGENQKKGMAEGLATKKAYETLVNQDFYLEQAVNASIGYLTHTYDIQSSKNLYIKGPLASKLVENSFKNFNIITMKGGRQTSAVNKWISYSHPPQVPSEFTTQPYKIGEPSATGAVISTHIVSAKNIEFVIKANKNPGGDTEKIFMHEFAVGMKLNNLRSHIPNYALTLGGFNCMSDPTLDRLCDKPTTFGSEPTEMQYIMLEYIDGITFKKYIAMPSINLNHILCVIAQVAIALLYGQNKMKFTHYDLHTDNVLLANNLYGDTSVPPVYTYKIEDVTYKVPAYTNATIIDYGDSHVDGLRYYHKDPGAVSMGKISSESDPYKDIYSLIIHTYHMYCITRPSSEVYDLLKSDKNPLTQLFDALVSSYGYLFILNPRKRIYDGLDKLKIFKSWHSDPKIDFQQKFMATKPLFNSLRTDNHYYLYLPKRSMPMPSALYPYKNSPVTFILKLLQHVPTGLEYRWGDYAKAEDIGCQLPFSTKVEQVAKIESIRKMFVKPETKSEAKYKSEYSYTPKTKETPKPTPKPKETPKPTPKPKETPKPTPKAKKSMGPSAEERRLLKDVKAKIETTIGRTGDDASERTCVDLFSYFSKFWSKVSEERKVIKSRKDLLKFRRYVLLTYHPDKVSEEKRGWAEDMTKYLNMLITECEKYIL